MELESQISYQEFFKLFQKGRIENWQAVGVVRVPSALGP